MSIERHLVGAMATTPETMAVAGLIDGDAIDPGAQARLAPKAANRSKDAEKDLLGEVERFVAVAEQVDRELDDHPLVLFHQFGVRHIIASGAALNECRLATADFRPTSDARLLHGEVPNSGRSADDFLQYTEIRPRLPGKVPVRPQ